MIMYTCEEAAFASLWKKPKKVYNKNMSLIQCIKCVHCVLEVQSIGLYVLKWLLEMPFQVDGAAKFSVDCS